MLDRSVGGGARVRIAVDQGCAHGSTIETEDTLAFSVLEKAQPMIQKVPLENAAGAYTRMRREARLRIVLLTGK
jgi:propanol-preferring alcohol dehydrogenase